MASKLPGAVAALVTVAVISIGPAFAEDAAPWPVKKELIGKVDKKGKQKKAKDVSGIACASTAGFPRTCLLINDEGQGAQVVILKDGELKAGSFIPLIDDKFDGEALELDGEGVVYADGDFYVIGSHGHPRDKKNKLDPVDDADEIAASIAANSKVIRITLDGSLIDADGQLKAPPKIERLDKLHGLIKAQPLLKPFVDKRLDQNGLTIEGIAIRDKRVFVGLRGPVLTEADVARGQVDASTNKPKVQAAIYSVALASLADGKAVDARTDWLNLGEGRGIRDLASFGNGLLVLAGPSEERKGDYAIYFWDGTRVRWLYDLPRFKDADDDQLKPEALLPLDSNADGLRVLVLFDGAKEGEPRTFRITQP